MDGEKRVREKMGNVRGTTKKPHECNESKYPCRESISWRREMARGMLSNLPALISRLKATGKKDVMYRCRAHLLGCKDAVVHNMKWRKDLLCSCGLVQQERHQ